MKAIDLAHYIVKTCIDEEKFISNLQLQKIMYFVQLDAMKRGSLAFDDDFEAWRYGPVIPDVYYTYYGSGALPIVVQFQKNDFIPLDKKRIDQIVQECRRLDPWELVELTHKENGPWHEVYQDGIGQGAIIPKAKMKVWAKKTWNQLENKSENVL